MLPFSSGQYLCEKLKSLNLKLIDLLDKFLECEDKLEKLSMDITTEVLTATDQSGKPLYTNDLARKSAIHLKCEQNQEFQKLKELKKNLEIKKKKLEALIEYYRNLIKIYTAETINLQRQNGIV